MKLIKSTLTISQLFSRGRDSQIIVLLLLMFACLSMTGWFYAERQQWLMQEQQNLSNKAHKAANKAAEEIEKTLKMVESAARTLAYELNSGQTRLNNLEQRMRQISETTPLIFGVGVAYRPQVLQQFMTDNGLVGSLGSDSVLNQRGLPASLNSTKQCAPTHLQPYLLAPYLRRNDQYHSQRDLVMVNKSYDYTCATKYWYRCPLGLDPLNCPKPQLDSWQEPYFGQASQRMVEEFSLPFYSPQMSQDKGDPTGAVWANMSLRDFKKLMATMNFGQSAYGFILSPKGIFISHPDDEYIKGAKTIESDQTDSGDDLKALFKRAISYGTQVGQHIDPRTGKDAIWIFEPIQRTQWVLGLVYQKHDLLGKPRIERMQIIAIALSLIAFCLFASLLVLRLVSFKGVKRYWVYSWCGSFFLCLAISAGWYTVISYPIYKDGNSVSFDSEKPKLSGEQQHSHMIMREWQVEQFERQFSAKTSKVADDLDIKPTFVPTGLFIQSLNFVDANSVKLTGYIWQKLPADPPGCSGQLAASLSGKRKAVANNNVGFWQLDTAGRCQYLLAGVIFPEAKDIDTASAWPFLEIYRRSSVDGGTTIGWYFDILLRQRFDYQLYPFDVENVWLRMWHRDIGKNVVLTPDLLAYPGFSPTSLTGLEADFVLPGWALVSSFFDYKAHSYQTNFGLPIAQKKHNFPELHFNIILKRQFLGAFIGNLMPLLVVLMVLFALVLSTSNAKHIEILGFSFSNVLASSSGLLFGVLLGHTELRASLKASGLVYMESFYLIMYLMLLLVILNAYLYAKHPDLKIVKWADNLAAKLVFWPLLFSLILTVTLYYFYF